VHFNIIFLFLDHPCVPFYLGFPGNNFVSQSCCMYISSYSTRSDCSSLEQCLTTDWTTGIRSPAGAVDLSCSLCVQSSCEAHPSSYPMVRGVVFSGVKRGRGVTLTMRPHIVLRSRMSRGCTSCHPWRLHGVAEQFYFTSHAGHVVCILCMKHPPLFHLFRSLGPTRPTSYGSWFSYV
jgi:hypothetical protein